jgi:hypothetical protein
MNTLAQLQATGDQAQRLLEQARQLEQLERNQWYFYLAYTLVWVLLLVYLVRLHVLLRAALRAQLELQAAGGQR